jgi:hypothetical protein
VISRRQFVAGTVAPLFGAPPQRPGEQFFGEIVRGFARNARATSPTFAVCDFPGGTKLKNCVARSGKTYVSVARMLPALAAMYAAGRRVEGVDIGAILLAAFRNAFDPASRDYWEEPPAQKSNQRQVEASLVGWSLWRAGDSLLARLTSRERANIQAWLASCTRVAERKHNHAWFSAINHAARLGLAQRWKEFSGNEQWMLADLDALDKMGTPGDGWYSDSLTLPIFDYYNFWTFASHFLEWRQIIGRKYPEIAERFQGRLRLFLEKTPYFFSADGSHPLFGRSLIYRWAVLLPLVAAYEQGLWPHSPGLLRRIVRLSLEYHSRTGSYDGAAGKLRETYSAQGTAGLREFYVDNGHPYWCMPAFSYLALPRTDPFWTAPEEPLPVERGDYLLRFDGPRMLLAGTRASGQVRWIQAQCAYHHVRYRDKYIKFSYSSHFPFNIIPREDRCPWDAALVFRNPATGNMAARAAVDMGELTADGVHMRWHTELDGRAISVESTIRVSGEFETRRHEVTGAEGFEALEGSAALGLQAGEQPSRSGGILRSGATGCCVASWPEAASVEIAAGTNVIYPGSVVNTLRTVCRQRTVLRSVHYASPKPLDDAVLHRRARELHNSI